MDVVKNLADGTVGTPAIVRRGRNTLQTLCGSAPTKSFITNLINGFESKLEGQPIARPQPLYSRIKPKFWVLV